jgi:hypothetical protein
MATDTTNSTSTNLGLNMFLSAFGRQPESQDEIDFINEYTAGTQTNTTTDTSGGINFPTTALDSQVNQVGQARQDFSTPNVFLSFLKAGLNAKLQPQEEQLGTSPLYEAAGLTGMPTLMQSLGARQDQLVRSGADLAKVLQTSSGIYGDYYNLLDTQYKELTTKQSALIEQQWAVEKDLRDFNQSLYMLQRQEELARESADIQAKLDVWKNQQTTATGLAADKELFSYEQNIKNETTAWENALEKETYAYKSNVDTTEYANKASIDANIETQLSSYKEQLKQNTNLQEAEIDKELAAYKNLLDQQSYAYKSGVDTTEYANRAEIDSQVAAYRAALDAQTPNTQIITANGTVQLVDKNTGKVIQDFGSAYKTNTSGTTTTPKTTGTSTTKQSIPTTTPKTKSELQPGVAYKFPDSNKVYQWTGTEFKHIPDEETFKQIYGGLPEENTNYQTLSGSLNTFMNESTVNAAGTNENSNATTATATATKNGWIIENGKATKVNESFPSGGVPEKKLEVSVPQENTVFRTGDTSPIYVMKNGQIYTLSPEDVLGTRQQKNAQGGIDTIANWSGSNTGEAWKNYVKAALAKLGLSESDIANFNSADLVSVFGSNWSKASVEEIKKLLNS